MVDMATPSHSWWEVLPDWVDDGSISKKRVDDVAVRIIAVCLN